jgi:D-alanyl-D-alanine carboxypeptidase
MQAGRRRPRRALPVRWRWVALGIVLLIPVVAVGVVLWRVLPLTDTGAGVIPPSALTGVAPSPSTGGASPAAALDGSHASNRPIKGVGVAAGIVVDAGSGRVLWAHRPHAHRPVASLTKLMTALLTSRGNLQRRFTVTRPMTGELGYTIGLRVGEQVRVRDMLAAMLIASANDAADALAVHHSGSVKAFVRLMNHQAQHLKLADTRYSNPSGIIDAGNHSSAWDIATLARLVLARPALRALVGAKQYQPAGGGARYVSGNTLLWNYPDTIGIKTGQTTLAGNCLAAAAVRGGHTLIAVLLAARGDEFSAAERMLDWGFHRDHA